MCQNIGKSNKLKNLILINKTFFSCFLNAFQCKFFNSGFCFDQTFIPLYEFEVWVLVFDILGKKT